MSVSAAQEAVTQEWVQREIATALRGHRRKVTILAMSGEMDRLFGAMSVATGAASAGLETTIFFTFWSIAALRDPVRAKSGKGWLDRLLAAMLPAGAARLPVSAMNCGGLGACFLRWVMRNRKVTGLQELIEDARDLGVRLVACQMSLGVLGLGSDELLEGVEIGGVASYLKDATESTVTLFV